MEVALFTFQYRFKLLRSFHDTDLTFPNVDSYSVEFAIIMVRFMNIVCTRVFYEKTGKLFCLLQLLVFSRNRQLISWH